MSGGALLLPSTIAETVSHQHQGGQETSSSGPPSNASSADSFKLEIKQEPFEEVSNKTGSLFQGFLNGQALVLKSRRKYLAPGSAVQNLNDIKNPHNTPACYECQTQSET